MKKKNNGFMIVELLLSVFLAGIVIAIASSMPLNMIKLGTKFNFIFNQNLNIATFYNQIEKDLSSAFSAELFSLEEIKKKDSNPNPDEKKSDATQEPDKSKNDAPSEEEKPEKIIFISNNHDDNSLDFMAFLSTNKLQIEVGEEPLFSGVAYLVEQNKNKTYDFFRAEFSDYDFDFSKKEELLGKIEKKFLILKNIEKLETSFVYKTETGSSKINPWLTNFKSDKIKIDPPRLPNFVKIKLSTVENKIKNEFEFSIPVFSQTNAARRKNSEIVKDDKEKTETKNNLPPGDQS